MNGYFVGSGPLGSGPNGPGSDFSVMPRNSACQVHTYRNCL